MPKYCLPIINNSKNQILDLIKMKYDSYDYFEIWLDYVENLDLDFVKKLTQIYQNHLIFLFRRQNLEPSKISFNKRCDIYKILDQQQAYVDLDFRTQSDDLKFIEDQRLNFKKILSYHNYQFTPGLDELNKIVEEACSHQADIVKTSTYCKTTDDALRLLNLRLDFNRLGIKSIVLGMGPDSAITRIFGTLWGNVMVFCPEQLEDASAPGQFTYSQLRDIFNILE